MIDPNRLAIPPPDLLRIELESIKKNTLARYLPIELTLAIASESELVALCDFPHNALKRYQIEPSWVHYFGTALEYLVLVRSSYLQTRPSCSISLHWNGQKFTNLMKEHSK